MKSNILLTLYLTVGIASLLAGLWIILYMPTRLGIYEMPIPRQNISIPIQEQEFTVKIPPQKVNISLNTILGKIEIPIELPPTTVKVQPPYKSLNITIEPQTVKIDITTQLKTIAPAIAAPYILTAILYLTIPYTRQKQT